MLESIFIFIMILAVVFFILGIERECTTYNMISLILWIVILLQALYVETFYTAIGFNDTAIYNVTTGYAYRMETGISILSLMFIITCIINQISIYFGRPFNKGRVGRL